MFCRSCWANVPDGTVRCPKCQADPLMLKDAAAPANQPGSARRAPMRPARAPFAGMGTNFGRLNVLLGAALIVLIAGPPVARWYQARWTAEPVAAPSRWGSSRTGGPALEGSVPAPVEPAASAASGGVEATLSREALALYREGRVAEACEKYREVFGRASSEDARRNLAACFARLGRDAYHANQAQVAVEHYQRALDVNPGAREIRAALAITLVKAGDLGRAQSVLEQAARSFPDDAEALYLLADVQERQGRTREAADTLRRLLAAHPGHARARTLLASLEREQKVEGSYWTQESRHFLVRYEGAGGIEVGRSVVDLLEQAYESIGQDLGVYPKERVQVGIYVTETFAELAGVPREFAEHILGFYDTRKLRLRLSASTAHSIALERLVRHEYAHLVIHQATNGRATRWLHEGLAQVVEPRAAPRLVYMEFSLDRQHFTLDGLERLFRSNAVGAAYQLSHVVAEYLVERSGMAGMRAFLGRLGQGEPVPQALKDAFGLGVEDVEGRLLAAGGRS